jgi:hypothetical protein
MAYAGKAPPGGQATSPEQPYIEGSMILGVTAVKGAMVPCVECGGQYTLVTVVGPKRDRFCCSDCHDVWWTKWRQTPWPSIPTIDMDNPEFFEVRAIREELVHRARTDPWAYGWYPDHWIECDEVWGECGELLVSGGNRAGKTYWAARKVVEALLVKEGAKVICCHTSSQTSVSVQQSAIYNYLPLPLKQTKKGKIHYLNYSMKNGFTDGSFILPNGSRCDFLNYSQNELVLEGREADFVWCDEIVPESWVETIRFRLMSRQGKLLVTQTPIDGVASAYRVFIGGGRISRWADADLVGSKGSLMGWPAGKAPRVMDCINPNRKVFWMYTKDNVFCPWEAVKKTLFGLPFAQVLTRAYGWACDNQGKSFPRFNPDVHVVTKVPDGGTLYQCADPAGSRNWFSLWVRVVDDTYWVVREWPDRERFGEWSLPSNKADGKAGPATKEGGPRGYVEYRAIFRDIDSEDIVGGEPMLRLLDPRAAGTMSVQENGGVPLIDQLAMDSDSDEGMAFLPAPAVLVDQRTATINSLLAYDPERPLAFDNMPKLFIHESCGNLIWSMSEHTGRDGQKGATKDPVDCLGMLVVSSCIDVGAGGLASVGGGAY